jgi:hypothetical protein
LPGNLKIGGTMPVGGRVRQKVAGLIQERYAITREEADKQVKSFFEKLKSLFRVTRSPHERDL